MSKTKKTRKTSSRKRKKSRGRTLKKTFITIGLIAILGMGGYVAAECNGIDDPVNFVAEKAMEKLGLVEPSDNSDAEEAVLPVNPLTGEGEEDGFDPDALNRRVAAFVVENTPDARPQWGMDDPDYSPDIILQGEVEGGITRTLWMYADYNKLPSQIGPMRSARPPYIRFSELFDGIFIHWGQSSSKGDYIGANEVFQDDKVDHINQMTFDDTVGLYDRDGSRGVSAEHTGIVYGDKVPAAIKAKEFRTEPNDYTQLSFSPLPWLTTLQPADTVRVNFSSQTGWETTVWNYDPEDEMYHTENFRNDLKRDNLLILYDDTEYIAKYDYMGVAGYTVVYCDYKFKGGKGQLLSRGRVKEIEWKVEDGQLMLIDPELTEAAREKARAEAEAAEAESTEDNAADTDENAEAVDPESIVIPASLNVGKTWIGWISANNGGNVEILANGESTSTEG